MYRGVDVFNSLFSQLFHPKLGHNLSGERASGRTPNTLRTPVMNGLPSFLGQERGRTVNVGSHGPVTESGFKWWFILTIATLESAI